MSLITLPPDTDEQARITRFKGSRLVVKAFAGTGKTTTLEKFALRNSDTRILYLAFQRSVADEAKARFPKNVTCKTSHQLAYAAVGKSYKHKQKSGIRLQDVAHAIQSQNWAVIRDIISTLNTFLVSGDTSVLNGHTPNNDLPRALSAPELRYKSQLTEIAEHLWNRMRDKNDPFPMTHDGYLKLYQLEKPDLALRYGCILFDEAQDANPVTTELVLDQRCQLIFVGDPHQQIYRFRGADNALETDKMVDALQLQLSHSFRFGPEVALVANAILRLKDEQVPLVGRGPTDTVLLTMPSHVGHVAVLSRTVIGTIQSALDAVMEEKKVFWLGGLSSYQIDNVLDVYWLKHGQTSKIKNQRLHADYGGDFDRYKKVASETGDTEMRRALQLLKNPNLLDAIDKLQSHTVDCEKLADITVSTVHKAKGMEWDNVIISNDFPDLFSLKPHSEEWCDEVNLLYVAATRAMTRLVINEPIEMILRKELLEKLNQSAD